MAELLGVFGFLVVLLRAAILCFQTIVAGGTIFLSVVLPKVFSDSQVLKQPAWKVIRGCALGLALSQVFFLFVNGLVLRYSTDLSFAEVLSANFAIAGVVAIGASLLILFWPESLRNTGSSLALIPALVVVASSVVTSHSFSRIDDRTILMGLTSLHYLATAAWIGGLPYLLLALRRVMEPEARVRISQRFSRLAQVSVAVLFFAGLGMTLVYVGSWNALYGTAYGIMVGTKIALFACLLLLGTANYYIVKGAGSELGTMASTSLIRFGEVEIGIGLAVILAAASLTSQPPGADLAEDRVSLHEIAGRYAPRMPQLKSPPLADLSPSGKEMKRKAIAAGI